MSARGIPKPTDSPCAPPTIPFRTAATIGFMGRPRAQAESERTCSGVTLRRFRECHISEGTRPGCCSVLIQGTYLLGVNLIAGMIIKPSVLTPTRTPPCTSSTIIPRSPITQRESERSRSRVTIIRIRNASVSAGTRTASCHSILRPFANVFGAVLVARIVVVPAGRLRGQRTPPTVPLGAGAAVRRRGPVARREPERPRGVVALRGGRHALGGLGTRVVHEVGGQPASGSGGGRVAPEWSLLPGLSIQ